MGSGMREARYLNAYDRPILVAAAALLERARTDFDEELYQRMAETRQALRTKDARHRQVRGDGADPADGHSPS